MVAASALLMSLVYGPPETVPRYTMYPTTLEELADQLSATECVDAEALVLPDNVTLAVELFALLLAESDAVKDPEVTGAKATCTVADFPEAIERGRVAPVTLKTLSPVKPNCEMVSVPPPTLVMRKLCVPVAFTATVAERQLSWRERDLGRR